MVRLDLQTNITSSSGYSSTSESLGESIQIKQRVKITDVWAQAKAYPSVPTNPKDGILQIWSAHLSGSPITDYPLIEVPLQSITVKYDMDATCEAHWQPNITLDPGYYVFVVCKSSDTKIMIQTASSTYFTLQVYSELQCLAGTYQNFRFYGGDYFDQTGIPSTQRTGNFTRHVIMSVGVEQTGDNPLTTEIYSVASGVDDGSFQWAYGMPTGFSNSPIVMSVGYEMDSVYSDSWVRFANVAIPVGSTITHAHLELSGTGNINGAGSLTVQASLHPNRSAPTSDADCATQEAGPFINAALAIPANASGVLWTVDIAPLIRQLIEQVGWTSGNAMVFYLYGTGINPAVKLATYNNLPSSAARLVVSYSTPSTEPEYTSVSYTTPLRQTVSNESLCIVEIDQQVFTTTPAIAPLQQVIGSPAPAPVASISTIQNGYRITWTPL